MTERKREAPAVAEASAIPDDIGSGSREDHTSLSIPGVGLVMTDDHRYYWNGEGPLPSVTTILGIIDKPALVNWAKREVAQTAIRHLAELPGMVADAGEEQAARWLASTPDHKRDTAGKLGTGVHHLADMASRGSEIDATAFEMPTGTEPYIRAFQGFLEWLRGSGGEIISSEKAVVNITEGYAGTYDLLVRIDGLLWLIDIKTSKGIYAEYGLQLAGYSRCDFIALPNDPRRYPMPKIDRFGILHLRPELYADTGWRLAEFGITDRDYLAFLGAREVFMWKREGRFRQVGGVR